VSNIGPYGIKLGVVPNGGGWRFPFPEEHAQRLDDKYLRADGYWKLVSNVRIFRVQAGIKVGAVEWEVAEYIKEVSPANAAHPSRIYEQPEEGRPDYRPPIVRIAEWLILKGMVRDVRRVIKPDALERAEVCAQCPHNIQWKTSCKPCVEEVEYRGQNLRSAPIFEMDDKLGACRLHSVLLGAAVFLDIDELPPKQPDAPADCWLALKP
jgi:hypothetical protein